MVDRCDMDMSPSHHLFVWSKQKGANPTWLLEMCQEARNAPERVSSTLRLPGAIAAPSQWRNPWLSRAARSGGGCGFALRG
jgi:hypothetical protein